VRSSKPSSAIRCPLPSEETPSCWGCAQRNIASTPLLPGCNRALNQHTIIFVPHARAKFRKWRVTSLQVGLVFGSLLALTVGGLIATYSYFTTAVDRQELVRIETQNEDLRQVNESFETSIHQLQDQLADYQERIHKLAIVAGLAELSPGSEAGIGGMEPNDALLEDRWADNDGLGRELVVDRETELKRQISFLRASIHQLGGGMERLDERLTERRLLISSIPAISPVKGLMTSRFGFRRDPFTGRRARHGGLDIVAPPGKPVVASGDGVITMAGRNKGLGIAVQINHGYGITTRYGHMSRIVVEAGQRIKRGEVIGHVGNTGRSTGYHLHYEVRLDGRPTNPLAYIHNSISE